MTLRYPNTIHSGWDPLLCRSNKFTCVQIRRPRPRTSASPKLREPLVSDVADPLGAGPGEEQALFESDMADGEEGGLGGNLNIDEVSCIVRWACTFTEATACLPVLQR